jgi:hypothetical protein
LNHNGGGYDDGLPAVAAALNMAFFKMLDTFPGETH